MTSESILVAAAFEHAADAEAAVAELGAAGFGQSDVSVLYTDRGHMTEQGVLQGAAFGGLIGGLTGLLFPPLGIVIAAGPILGSLAAAIGGAGLGAVTIGAVGGLTAVLVQAGMPQELAGRFGEHVHKGDTLVLVHTSREEAERARQILESHNPRTATDAPAAAQPDKGAVVTTKSAPPSTTAS